MKGLQLDKVAQKMTTQEWKNQKDFYYETTTIGRREFERAADDYQIATSSEYEAVLAFVKEKHMDIFKNKNLKSYFVWRDEIKPKLEKVVKEFIKKNKFIINSEIAADWIHSKIKNEKGDING